MNKWRFKLVFSKRLGMVVPIAEIARSPRNHAGSPAHVLSDDAGDQAATPSSGLPLMRLASRSAALWLAGCLTVLAPAVSAQDANTLPTGGNIVTGNGVINVNNNVMNINTLTDKATIRWDSFNIGANASVNFAMPSTASSVLNRVMGSSKSLIEGILNANGHVYLVNQNGIYFGAGSQINVGSLTATTLDNLANSAIEDIYNKGILSNPTAPVFSFADAVGVIDVAGKELNLNGQVIKNAASINTSLGGRVMLLAPDVKNSGLINAPDGQVILAAGKTIYLSTLDKFAGLLVEVNGGGTATNLGDIFVNNGNASLIGLAVNQQGRISASTSVRANGSVYLKAKEIQSLTTPGNDVYGQVTLGKDSVTAVTINTNDKEEVIDAQTITPSVVDIQGKDINILGKVVANSGQVNVTGRDNQANNSSIYLGDQAVIDVSGVDATAPMSRNQLAIQLFSDQLRDSPVLRGGNLFGQWLYLDARKGTKLLSQSVIDEAMASTTRTIAERSNNAGSVNLNAVNVVTKAGSTVDVSAGSTTYTPGYIRESSVLINNKYVLASEAQPGIPYQGLADFYTAEFARWGEKRNYALTSRALNGISTTGTNVTDSGYAQAAYQQGGDAGSLNISATNLALQGALRAQTTVGLFQRGDSLINPTPLGGLLNIDYGNAGAFNFVKQATALADNFDENSALSTAQQQVSEVGVGVLQQGVNRVKVRATGQINVNERMQFAANGELQLQGRGGVNIQQDIRLPSGQVTLAGGQTADVVMADNTQLNVSGLFTNDITGVAGAMQGPIALNGGSVSVSNGLRMGSGASIQASAGAWLNRKGQISAGHGGDITATLADNRINENSFSSYGFLNGNTQTAGGHLTLQFQDETGTGLQQDVQLGGRNPNQANTLWLSERFFNTGGFSAYALSNSLKLDGDIMIGDAANTAVRIQPQQASLQLNSDARATSSGADLAGLTKVVKAADTLRSPTSLSLAAGDDLTLQSNAQIVTDAPNSLKGDRGNVSLSSVGQMTVLGDITAPAANITLSIANIPETGDKSLPNRSFDNTLSLFVGDTAQLSSRGQYVTPPTADGNLKQAFVADAGTITLQTGNGVVILKDGSTLDVSGAGGNVDVPVPGGFSRQAVYGRAGTIALKARDGLAADGSLLGKAAGSGEAGSLQITLGGEAAQGVENDSLSPLYFPNGQRTLTVTQNKQLLAQNNSAGGSVANLIKTPSSATPLTNAQGVAQISAAQVSEGGFDHLSLSVDNVSRGAGDSIQFAGNVNLAVPSLLSLDATTLSGAANLSAGTLVLTNRSNINIAPSALQTQPGTLRASANFIDIQGNVSVDNVSETRLLSQSDIRGRGILSALQGSASLNAPGLIELQAAQVYPSTATTFTVNATGTQSQILVTNPNQFTSKVPLSATGSLTLNANSITQSGVLRAPLGQITLNATDRLTITENSLTSVSAEGSLIPYALTVLGGSEMANTPGAITNFISAIDGKKVALNSRNIDVRTGARIDVSGNGDTLAYEWIQGIGGSVDVLNQAGYYAVLPSLGSQYAPYDFLMQTTSVPEIGQAVALAGGNGLSAGTYTLLPARYALMPGAFLIKASDQTVQLGTSLTLPDGSSLSSGYLTKLDGTSRGQNGSFEIINGNTFTQNYGTKNYKGLAEYLLTTGNRFITNKALRDGRDVPRLAGDAGQVVLAAADSLNLNGSIVTDKAAGGRGALVDIASNDIRVVSAVNNSLTGSLQISAQQLNAIQADSVLLGGSRQVTGDSQTINTTANNVRFEQNAGDTVKQNTLIVAAKDTISVASGAVIDTAPAATTIGQTTLTTTGDGAVLAVSNQTDFNYARTGVSATPTLGTLNLAQGSSVKASRSMVLDATAAFNRNGDINVSQKGQLVLGANQFSIGDQAAPGKTVISSDILDDFGQLSGITFNSYKNIDIQGNANFGNQDLNISLNTAGLAHQGAGNVSITAKQFTLKNTNDGTFSAPTSNQGQLQVNAQQINFGATGTTSTNIAGFDQVALNAAQQVGLSGKGQVNINANSVNMQSAGITADTGTQYQLTTTGTLQTTGNGQTLSAQASSGIGASVGLTAQSMQFGGSVVLQAGNLSATATTGSLQVSDNASLSVKAATVNFDARTQASTDAGNINLTATNGNVSIGAQASLDLSAASAKSDAGKLTVQANKGQFLLANDAKLTATATQGDRGQFALDVQSLDNFSSVNQALEQGQFTQAREMRVRSGNVNIAAGDTVTAKQITLGVDNGNVTIAGTLNADAAKGGDVAIYASGTVSLANSAVISARGQQANASAGDMQTGSGGKVLLSSNSLAADAIKAEAGARIDVGGYDKAAHNNVGVDGADGSVTLRARRGVTGTANTVNVTTATTAAIQGASEVRVEGARQYTSTTFNAASLAGMITDTNAFYNNANTVASSYAKTADGLSISVLPYIEIRSTTGNTATGMTVGASASDINLRSFGALLAGRGGALSLRANGDLTVAGSLSDGFSTATTAGILQANTQTFDLNLVAGADYAAANPLAVVNGVGNVSLASSKLIRTGEGDINVMAGGNLTLGSTGSVIYTTGKAVAPLVGFTAASTGTNVPNAASYVNNGGDIRINVGGNITAAATTQSVNQWLLRQGSNTVDTSWWVRPDLFQQGVAALGGGNVEVTAGGSINNLSAASATNAQYDTAGSNPTQNFVVNGGGDVTVRAGQNLINGVYYAGRGQVALTAGDSVVKNGNTGTVIALQEASAEVKAKNNVKVETVFNPTLWVQGSSLAANQVANSTFFNTYSPEAALDIRALSGNVELGLARAGTLSSSGLNAGGYSVAVGNDLAAIHPGSVSAVAFGGSITPFKLILSPAANGNLSLLAAGSVIGGLTAGGSVNPTGNIVLSDADLSSILNVNAPTFGNPNDNTLVLGALKTAASGIPVHSNDPSVVTIVAQNGDVSLTGTPTARASTNIYGIKSAKPVYVSAGNNVTLHASIQHNQPDDISVIRAGNDFVMENGKQQARLDINGPGEVLIAAGRNVDLGNTSGILSLANTLNPNLSAKSANVTLLAGLGKLGTAPQAAAVDAFFSQYIDPKGAGPAALQNDPQALANYRADTAARVQKYMSEQTGQALSADQAMQQLLALDGDRKAVFAYRQFQAELLAAGRTFIDSKDTTRADQVIASLFPALNYRGDMLMYQSQIRTTRDGDIALFAPGGLINAGVAANGRLEHDIGIVTEKGGNIGAYADGNFLVNQSKVITQYASDILVWSNNGDIDAGRGSKSALSVPERVVSVNTDGTVTVEVKGVAAGSGIRAQTYDPDGPNGPQIAPDLKNSTVALFAPRGVLDAGEAGVAAGNLLVGAIQVLNSTNITVAGASAGVPVADTGSLAGAALGATNTSAGASNALTENIGNQMNNQSLAPKELPPIVTVKTIRLED